MGKKNKKQAENSRFQAAVEYLTEYNGVLGAVVADKEGLTVACNPPGLKDGETLSAIGPQIFSTADRIIEKFMKPGCKYLTLKTDDRWLTVAAALDLNLIVVADRKVDDLLSVRIQRALEMIVNHIKEKYPVEIISGGSYAIKKKETMEASNV